MKLPHLVLKYGNMYLFIIIIIINAILFIFILKLEFFNPIIKIEEKNIKSDLIETKQGERLYTFLLTVNIVKAYTNI